MKLNIIKKLLIVILIPIAALTIYSINYLSQQYKNLHADKQNIQKLEIIETTSALLYTLKFERGLSRGLQNNFNTNTNVHKYYLDALTEHRVITDLKLQNYLQILEKYYNLELNTNAQHLIKTTTASLRSLSNLRKSVSNNEQNLEVVFHTYTRIITQLISLLKNININSPYLYSNINAINTLEMLQEYYGQERAIVAEMITKGHPSQENLYYYHNLLASQDDEEITLDSLIESKEILADINHIFVTYEDTYLETVREDIHNYKTKEELLQEIHKHVSLAGMLLYLKRYKLSKDPNEYENFVEKRVLFNTYVTKYLGYINQDNKNYKILTQLRSLFNKVSQKNTYFEEQKVLSLLQQLNYNPINSDEIKWFDTSTNKIADFHKIQLQIFNIIKEKIKADQEKNRSSLILHSLLTIFTISFLLILTISFARNINDSIKQLENGLRDFFNYINNKKQTPSIIQIKSQDEIGEMAKSINDEIHIIENNLLQDKYFIQEATEIVNLMKSGDFTKKVTSMPFNKNLRTLKTVLNELISLIYNKIQEQTLSLEAMNASLEDKVKEQTIELEQKVQEVTIAMQNAMQAEIAKDEFLANMSHEIRTPLNAILGFINILKKQTKEEETLKYLDIIDSSSHSLLTIINDILDFSKIQSGKFNITQTEVNILQEMHDATLLFASKTYEKNLPYAVYLDPKMPNEIRVDIVRVKQILSNLLSNAIKFTPMNKGIKVHVSCENSRLVIVVKDNGIGIAPHNLEKIFSAFEQADNTTTRKYGGTGLGLSISHKLAHLMNGELFANSKVDKGSTFTLDIPVQVLDDTPAITLPSLQEEKNTAITILNYNNKVPNVEYLKKYLVDFGFNNITETDVYTEDRCDLLFFMPDDEYNESVINHDIPTIAIIEDMELPIIDVKHITKLFTPFSPYTLLSILEETGIFNNQQKYDSLPKIDLGVEDSTTIQFMGKILVAEDNKTNQMLISMLLEDYGLEHEIAQNGIEVVEMYKNAPQNYDLILMDENMPELNGIGAMQQIKKYEKENRLKFTPIIALTASVLEADVKRFMEVGMDGFIGKPINNEVLESELSRFLLVKPQ